MRNTLKRYEGNRYRASVIFDELPDNPRNWDTLGHMVCIHKRYTLGDCRLNVTLDDFPDWDSLEKFLVENEEAVIVMPLFLRDVDGPSISLENSAYHGGDQVGFIYCTKSDLEKEYGIGYSEKHVAEAEGILRNEVETYNSYLQGEVFAIYVKDKKTGDTVEGIGGIYEFDYACDIAEVRLKRFEEENKNKEDRMERAAKIFFWAAPMGLLEDFAPDTTLHDAERAFVSGDAPGFGSLKISLERKGAEGSEAYLLRIEAQNPEAGHAITVSKMLDRGIFGPSSKASLSQEFSTLVEALRKYLRLHEEQAEVSGGN